MPTYAPTHHQILTQTQTDHFIETLSHAHHTGDVEKAVESAVNTLLTTGLTKIHPEATITHDYRNNTDGYIEITNTTTPYALLVEAKRDLNLSANKKDRATVYAQVCWYLRNLPTTGARTPSVVVICDTDEIFAMPANKLDKYTTNDTYPWHNYSASTMHQDATLLADLIQDSNLHHVYVHDIQAGFDPNMFLWAVDAMGQRTKPLRVPINKESMDHVFTRFKMEVLGTDATGLKNKDEISLFIDILRGNSDIYAHPKKPNTLVVGDKHLTLDTYRFEQFWSQYVVGDYTLVELKSLTEVADTLIEETDRRFTGDFWTPPRWVDKAHEYIENALGTDWKNSFVVVDPACGTLNLTRDYRFKELYASTLFQEELDIASDYNPEATKFQYDFLNDDMVLHEDGMTADKALELARAGKLKMPLGLVEALAANRPIVFFANPPYGQHGNGTKAEGRKTTISNTAVGDLMEGLNKAKWELYTQFIWRTKELAKAFGYTADFHICFFFNKTVLTSPNFGKFVNELTSEFTYNDGFMMNAGEFSGTSSTWGIVFSHFEIGGTNQREFKYDVLKSDSALEIKELTTWESKSVPKGEDLSSWFRDIKPSDSKDPRALMTKNGYDEPTSKQRPSAWSGWVGGLHAHSSNVQYADGYTGMYSMIFGNAGGYTVTSDNLERAAVTFSTRRSVQEVVAQQKLLWVRDKDVFTRPPESLLTDEFITDCMVYSLFDRQSKQTSLRDYEYNGQTYRVVNEFFPFDHNKIVELAQQHRNRTIEADAIGENDRLVHRWLTDHNENISTKARALLDLAWEIIEASFAKRSTFDTVTPRFQVQTWDAGWAQINAMVFGRDRVDNELYDQYYTQWRTTRAALGNKIARAAMDAGVI